MFFKFSHEFKDAVKKKIDEIADSYILPDENTYDFALMYIPAENVYYETIIREEQLEEKGALIDYAYKRKVIPVSPNVLYIYLHTIAMGLKGLRIEKSADEIRQLLGRLRVEFGKFAEDFRLLGVHLKNAEGKYNDGEKKLYKFNDKLEQASKLDSIEEGREEKMLLLGEDENNDIEA